MKIYVFLLLTVLMMTACTKPAQKTKPAQESTDSVGMMTDSSKSSIQARLCNTWRDVDNDEDTPLYFKKDSMCYVDEDPEKFYSYTLKGTSLIIYYSEGGSIDTIRYDISFHKDTLLMKNEYGKIFHSVPME
jgi:hypothetical protein